jgi:hypothetical protein
MNKQFKAISIILYLLWPFSAVVIGIKNFDYAFGRKLLIAAFVFLGYTASDTGDLERYASSYYEASDNELSYLLDLFLNLEIGKFFTDFTAIFFSVFDNHHIYFAFLFGFYGYFLINSIDLVRVRVLKRSNLPVIIGFVTFALFYSVLTVFNYAFYTGAIYFLYFLLQIILNDKNKKYYILIFLTPLFHFGLVPLLLIPMFYVFFGQRTKLYLLLLIVFTVLSQSFLIKSMGKNLAGSSAVIERQYNAYASEEGQDRMENRYSEGYQTGNSNYRLFRDIRELANKVAIPLLLFVLFLNRKKIKEDRALLNLFNISIACLAITNLMLNISQGERYYIISGFMVLAAFVYLIQKNSWQPLRFKYLLYLIIPCLLLNNLVSLILVKNLISSNFLVTNFPYVFYNLL